MSKEFVMELPSSFVDCPVAWQNFINDTIFRSTSRDHDGVSTEDINHELKRFNGVFKDTTSNTVAGIYFQSQKDATLFILSHS